MELESEDTKASFCPYCGRPVEIRPSSVYPYCSSCARHIFRLPGGEVRDEDRLHGIRGWLVLPAIGAALNPIGLLVSLIQSCSLLSDPYVPRLFREYPGLQSLGLVQLVLDMVFFVVSLWLAGAFFGKRAYAPAFYSWYIGLRALVGVLIAVGSAGVLDGALVPEMAASAAAMTGAALIWIPYFRVSKRVKATFVD